MLSSGLVQPHLPTGQLPSVFQAGMKKGCEAVMSLKWYGLIFKSFELIHFPVLF